MNNMDFFFWAFLVFFFRSTVCQLSTDNGRYEGIRCFEQIILEGDITNLLIDATTPQAIDGFCRRHSELLKCTRENEHYMSVQENTEYLKKTSGVHSFYKNVCPPGTDITTDYKGNAPCFKLIRNEILSCGSDLPDMNSYKMTNDLQSRCCALKAHQECLKKATSENCGNEAALVIEKMVLRYFNSEIKECNATFYSCNEDQHSTTLNWATSKRWSREPTAWNFPPYENPKRFTEREDWKSTTKADWKSTRAADGRVEWKYGTDGWKYTTEADEWKKHHKHSGDTALTLNSAFSIFSCLVAVVLYKL